MKGGQALLVRWPGARYSTDIDLWHTSAQIDGAIDALRVAAATRELMPQVQFEYAGRNRHQQERDDIYKVQFEPYVGTRRQRTVSVDVVTDLSRKDNRSWPRWTRHFPCKRSGRRYACGRWRTTRRTRSLRCTRRTHPATSHRAV